MQRKLLGIVSVDFSATGQLLIIYPHISPWRWDLVLRLRPGNKTSIKQMEKLLILQNQRRPDRFDQMLRSCWLVFFYANGIVHKEFVPPGQTVNQQFYWKALKRLHGSVWKKQSEMWSSGDGFLHHDNAPAPMALSVQQFLAKKTWTLSLVLPIHPTLRHVTFSCSLIWKARWKGNVLLMSAKWKRKH